MSYQKPNDGGGCSAALLVILMLALALMITYGVMERFQRIEDRIQKLEALSIP